MTLAYSLLRLGASSADVRCVETVTLESTLELPSLLDTESTLRAWLADPRGKTVLGPRIEKLFGPLLEAFGAQTDTETGEIDTSSLMFAMEMPLRDLLGFQAAHLPKSVEELLDDLLAEVHRSDV